MERKIVLWIVIAILLIATLFLTFKTGDVSASAETVKATGLAAKSAAASAPSSYSGMVGGC